MDIGFTNLDWAVIATYFIVTMSVGMLYAHRASQGVEDFFLAGRKLTWWLAGGSMVATMFASDTPLFHCGNVRDAGFSAGWLFLFPMFGALLAAALFAPLVRRTMVVTDAEFIQLRYSGTLTGPFRIFMAIYNGVFYATLIMAWVTKGMQETVGTVMHLNRTQETWSVVILLGMICIYSMAAGLWGVVMSDLFQYLVATLGSIYLAIAAVQACGGLSGLRAGVASATQYSGSDLHFWPKGDEVVGSTGEPLITWWLVIGWVIVQGIVMASSTQHQGQRILACRSDRDASLAYLLYAFCYYVVNGLPWFLIGLASIVVLGTTNEEAGLDASSRAFPMMISRLMPAGLLGLMVAAFFAAFMSTVSSLINWGGSYLINDLYRPARPDRSPAHYVQVGRLASLLIAVLGGALCLQFESLTEIMIQIPPLLVGVFIVYLLRMLWWRINIQAEIAALIASPILGAYVQFVMFGQSRETVEPVLGWLPGYGIWAPSQPEYLGWETLGQRLMLPMVGTAIIAVVTCYLTVQTDMQKLIAFYCRVRPPGPGWAHVRRQLANPPVVDSMQRILLLWLASVVFVTAAIVAGADWVRGATIRSMVCVLVSLVALIALSALFRNSHFNSRRLYTAGE